MVKANEDFIICENLKPYLGDFIVIYCMFLT